MTATADLQTSLLNRLQIERGYSLTADADEASAQLPDEQAWVDMLESAEDEERLLDIISRYESELDEHLESLGPVGGKFDRPFVRDSEGNLNRQAFFIGPPLLELKPYASRILVKRTPFSCKISLIIDAQSIDYSLSRDRLLEVASKLRDYEELAHADEEDGESQDDKAQSKTDRSSKPVPVLFEVVLIGPGALTEKNRAFLKRLKKSVSARGQVFILGFILDSTARNVWTTRPFLHWPDKRYFQHVLAFPNKQPEQIRENVESQRVRPDLVALGIIATAVLFLGGSELAAINGVADHPLVRYALDMVAPILGAGIGLAFNRLRVNCEKQIRYTVIPWLTAYSGFILYSIWPPELGALMYPASVCIFVWLTTQMMAIMADID